jgi:hypothetical protein
MLCLRFEKILSVILCLFSDRVTILKLKLNDVNEEVVHILQPLQTKPF